MPENEHETDVGIRRARFAGGKVDPRDAQRMSTEARERKILANLNLAREHLNASAPNAAQRLADLIDADRDDIALRASGDLLDRVGIGRSSDVTVTHEAGSHLLTLIQQLDAQEAEDQRLERMERATPVAALHSDGETSRTRPKVEGPSEG